MIGIFLCAEDGVEVYPRQGKSIFPHQKYRLPVWVVGIFLCAEDGVEVYPRQGKSIFPHQKYRLPVWVVGIFLCAEDGVEVYPRQGKSIFPHQKYRLSFWTVGIFYAFSRRERSGRALPSPRGEGAERSEADEVERSRPPPVPPVVPPNPTTLHPSRRTAAPPSPQGEGLQAPLRLHRCSDALGEAVYTPPHTPGAPSRAASSRRDRPLTSVSKQSAHTVSPPRTHGHRYASAHDGSGAKHTSHRRICVPPPFICKVIMHSDNFLHQFILVRIICQAVFCACIKIAPGCFCMRAECCFFDENKAI